MALMRGKRAAATPPPERRWLGWRRGLAVCGWLGTLTAVAWGMHTLDASVRASQPDQPGRLEWVDKPLWLMAEASQPILRQIAAATGLRAEDNIQDPDLVRRVGEALAQSPWVAQVQRVARLADGRIRVQARFREPFAFIEKAGYVYLVDEAGVRLPHKQFTAYVEERYWNEWLRIVGTAASVPEEGQAFVGDDLTAGLRLVQFLKQAGARGEVTFRPALRAVDVGNFRRREDSYDGELRVRTIAPKSYIAWGLPPGEEFSIEAGASRKLELLRALYSEHAGQFPDSWIYDVRGADGIRRWAYKEVKSAK